MKLILFLMTFFGTMSNTWANEPSIPSSIFECRIAIENATRFEVLSEKHEYLQTVMRSNSRLELPFLSWFKKETNKEHAQALFVVDTKTASIYVYSENSLYKAIIPTSNRQYKIQLPSGQNYLLTITQSLKGKIRLENVIPQSTTPALPIRLEKAQYNTRIESLLLFSISYYARALKEEFMNRKSFMEPELAELLGSTDIANRKARLLELNEICANEIQADQNIQDEFEKINDRIETLFRSLTLRPQ